LNILTENSLEDRKAMEIQKQKKDTTLVITVKGRLDALSAPDFEKDLLETIAQGEKKLLLDLSDLQYISSAGLRSFLILAKKLKAEQGEVLFCGLKGPVAEVFKISGFYSIFKIFDTQEEAFQD
jgi:anti-anti-sigma factor